MFRKWRNLRRDRVKQNDGSDASDSGDDRRDWTETQAPHPAGDSRPGLGRVLQMDRARSASLAFREVGGSTDSGWLRAIEPLGLQRCPWARVRCESLSLAR